MWQEIEGKLVKHYVFKDFKQALSFINAIGEIAESLHHHPEISNVYNKVTLSLCTHEQGNIITQKDYRLAEAIDALVL